MSSFTAPLETLTLNDVNAQPLIPRIRALGLSTRNLSRLKLVLRPYRYWLDQLHDAGPYIVVPYMFLSDGASIPRFIWPFVGSPWSGDYVQAAVLHDGLFRNQGWVVHYATHLSSKYPVEKLIHWEGKYIVKYPMNSCNMILRDAARVLGTPEWKCQAIYLGLRLGGFYSWYKWGQYWKNKKAHPLYVVNANPKLALQAYSTLK